MERLLQGLRFALRSLVKNPGVTLVAAGSLALGIGSVASIFSAVDVFMIRPLPYEASDELVSVYTTNAERGWSEARSSWADFSDWRRETSTLELAAYTGTGVNLSGQDQPERLSGYQVSAGWLKTIRVTPALGRGFLPGEEGPSGPNVVILSNAVWQRDFGADPSIVGRTVNMDGAPHEVVGVLPPKFGFGGPVDVLTPLRQGPDSPRENHWLRVVGRLAPGVIMEQARAEMKSIQAGLAETYPDTDRGSSVRLLSLQADWFSDGFRQGSAIAGVAVLFVLLIACANVANLLLARGAVRGREVALRRALGAGRGRIFRQLLTESLALALVGGVLGLLLSVLGIRWIRGLMPPTFPAVDQITLNARIVIFTLTAALGSGVIFGLAPSLAGAGADLRDSLSGGGRGGSARLGGRLRRSLVIAEISLSFVLLVAATLLVQGFTSLRTQDVGFDVDQRVTARLTLPSAKYPDATDRRTFFRELEGRVAAIPGVTAVGLASQFPLGGANGTYYSIPEKGPVEPSKRPTTTYRDVSPGYFDAMGMKLLTGRGFTTADDEDAPRVMVVNRRFAEREWPGESPIGKKVQIDSSVREVVGVVENTHDFGPDQDPPVMIYDPIYQGTWAEATVVAHTDQPLSSFVGALRETIRALDPDQPLYSVRTVRDLLNEWIGGNEAMAEILGLVALFAYLLAAVGVYGVMAYSVAQRRQEVGVRMALGAQRRDVLSLVLRQGGGMALLGIGVGLGIAFATMRFLAFFLYGVSPFDPATFIGVVGALLGTCMLASWIPARRATRVNPMTALKPE